MIEFAAIKTLIKFVFIENVKLGAQVIARTTHTHTHACSTRCSLVNIQYNKTTFIFI